MTLLTDDGFDSDYAQLLHDDHDITENRDADNDLDTYDDPTFLIILQLIMTPIGLLIRTSILVMTLMMTLILVMMTLTLIMTPTLMMTLILVVTL